MDNVSKRKGKQKTREKREKISEDNFQCLDNKEIEGKWKENRAYKILNKLRKIYLE